MSLRSSAASAIKQRAVFTSKKCAGARISKDSSAPTAGTVFHGARVPLWKWFWAMYQEAHAKKGIAAMALAKQIQVCYQTAWLMLQKLRDAMRQRCERYVLQGLVEVDETYVGGREAGRPGRGVEKKIPVGVAVELDKNNRPRRIAMQGMKRVDARSLTGFTTKHVAQGSCLRTDGWGSYRSVAKAGYSILRYCVSPYPVNPPGETVIRPLHKNRACSIGLVDLIGMVFDINFCSSWYSGSRFATRAIAWRHTA